MLDEFEILKNDTNLFLDSFIRAFERSELLADLNDGVFEGAIALEEARALRRLPRDLDPETALPLMVACLTSCHKQCDASGLPVMAFEASRLIDPLGSWKKF
jgi:hypothetical protein